MSNRKKSSCALNLGAALCAVMLLAALFAGCDNPTGNTPPPSPQSPAVGNDPWARVKNWHTFTSLAAASAFLADADLNSASTPYGIRLVGVNAADFHNGKSGAAKDSLGTLFAAFQGCYVALDLSQCTGVNAGTAFENPGANAFSLRPDAGKLVLLILPDGLETLGTCFSRSPALIAARLPAGLGGITGSFKECSALVSVNLPAGLVSIGADSFFNCASLASVSFPAGLETIGNNAFRQCASLVSASLPAGLGSLGNSAFRDTGIQSLTALPGITVIPEDCFSGCPSLRAVTLPEGLVEIGANAFRACPALEQVHLPRTLSTVSAGSYSVFGLGLLSSSPFTGAENLHFTVAAGGNFEVRENGRALVQVQGGSLIHPVLIAAPSLSGAITLSGYATIQSGACTAAPITSLVIDEGNFVIQSGAFANCTSLVAIDIPSTVNTSGPSQGFNRCAALESATFRREAVMSFNGTFPGYLDAAKSIRLYVPANQVAAYMDAEESHTRDWKKWYTIAAIPEGGE